MITNDVNMIMKRIKHASVDSPIAVWIDDAEKGDYRAAFFSTVISQHDANEPNFVGAFSRDDGQVTVYRNLKAAMIEARKRGERMKKTKIGKGAKK